MLAERIGTNSDTARLCQLAVGINATPVDLAYNIDAKQCSVVVMRI